MTSTTAVTPHTVRLEVHGTDVLDKSSYLLIVVPHIKHRKSFHEKLGLVTQRRLAIILKIRSKLTPFFFAIFEDSDIPPIIDSKIREQYPGSLMDFNLIDEGTRNERQS